MTFKPIILSAFASLALLTAACTPSPATLTGEIKNYRGGALEVSIKTDSAVVDDSLDIDAQGRFTYTRSFPHGAEVWLASEDAQGFVRLYLTDGDCQHITLQANADSIYGRCAVTLDGDAAASRYLWAYDNEFGSLYKWNTANAARFSSFKAYKAAVDSARTALQTALLATRDDAFIAHERPKLERKQLAVLFRYMTARSNAGLPTGDDPDFNAWADALDLNAPDAARNNLPDLYIRWYISAHPDSTLTPGEQYFDLLRSRLTDSAVITSIADYYMESYLNCGADADLAANFQAYLRTTSNQEKADEFLPLYNQIIGILPGITAPDFELKDSSGRTFRFLDVIGQGRVVYLDVWATWCGPCVAEIPHLARLAADYADTSDIDFISISLDDSRSKWLAKLKADKPTWKQFIVEGGMSSDFCRLYSITSIPRFMIFNRDGKIITTNAPRASDDAVIEALKGAIR